MVKCECCSNEARSSKIYRLSLDDDAPEKRVCPNCFAVLMDTSKAVRMQSGQIAWEMAKEGLSSVQVDDAEIWLLSKLVH